MLLSAFDIQTRNLVNRFFVEEGFPPTTSDLAVRQNCRHGKIEQSLKRLHDDHRLLLFPNTHDIWVAHPFSSVPSNYWVKVGDQGWWGNCGFCSLGIAAMLGGVASIFARLGAEQTPIQVCISEDSIEPRDFQLHVPLPIARWHDNLIYTCSNVHYFALIDDIDVWCERHSIARGQAISLDRAWALAKNWYGNYLEPSWQPRSNVETNSLLQDCGLSTTFWRLPAD